jgi:hypothetical protein
VERLDRLHQHVLRGYADGGYVHTESNYVPHLLSIDSPSHSGGFGGASGGRLHPDDIAAIGSHFERAMAKMPAPVFDRNALTDGVSQGGQRRTQLSWQ